MRHTALSRYHHLHEVQRGREHRYAEQERQRLLARGGAWTTVLEQCAPIPLQ